MKTWKTVGLCFELFLNFQNPSKPCFDAFMGFGNVQDFYGLRNAEFVVPLVKAVQELSKENKTLKNKAQKADELATKVDSQQKQIDELKEALIKLVNQQKCLPTTGK